MPDDATKGTGQDAHKALFAGLIMMLGSSAMQQLGKLVDPSSGKSAVSLEGAQSTIDLLDMLRAKTQGNLDSDEEKMLRDLLASLQMNYVQVAETMKKKPSAPPPAPTAEKSAEPSSAPAANAGQPEAPASATAEPAAEPEKKEAHQPKFHKSYGA